jgi:hypothetical protein
MQQQQQQTTTASIYLDDFIVIDVNNSTIVIGGTYTALFQKITNATRFSSSCTTSDQYQLQQIISTQQINSKDDNDYLWLSIIDRLCMFQMTFDNSFFNTTVQQ